MRLRDAGSLEAGWDKDSNEPLSVLCSYLLYHYPFIHAHVSNRKERASHRIQEVVVGRELCSVLNMLLLRSLEAQIACDISR